MKDYKAVIEKTIQDVVLQEGPLSIHSIIEKTMGGITGASYDFIAKHGSISIHHIVNAYLNEGFLVLVGREDGISIYDLASQVELRS